MTPKPTDERPRTWFSVGPKVDAREVRLTAKVLPEQEKRAKVSTVLAIDDDANIRDLMERFLTRQGFYAYTAANGEEGLEMARRIRPDVITLDVMMAEKDGWSVLAELKKDPFTAHIPVIMLTMVEDRELGYALGAADFLQKPVDKKVLADVISRHIRLTAQTSVLLVLPDRKARYALAESLENSGLRVYTADHGLEALELLEKIEPTIIVTELIMPVMDGVKFMDELKQHPRWRDIPTIVIAAEEIPPDKARELTRQFEAIVMSQQSDPDGFLRELEAQLIAKVRQSAVREAEPDSHGQRVPEPEEAPASV